MSRVGIVTLGTLLLVAFVAPPRAAALTVTTAEELRSAVAAATPGTVITLAPGTYLFTAAINFDAAGTSASPITLRAETLGDAQLRSDTVELFRVRAAHWIFENLDIEGICASDSTCEHAFHIVENAHHTVVRECRLHGFNAAIKGNGQNGTFPNDVLVELTEIFNPAPRNTANPVTPIDVVGGQRWTVRKNFIHDHAKGGGDNISYAAFLKGNSRDGLFEGNLVICELLHTGHTRLGLSFGGGGTGPDSVCEEGTCSPEHRDGIMRNNVIVNCPADVGIYLNEAQNARIFNNTLFATTGIDVRFAASTVEVRNNVLTGAIRERDGGTATLGVNRIWTPAQFAAAFLDPSGADFRLLDGTGIVDTGETLALADDDYCGNLRDDAQSDVGAVEYDGDGVCDTRSTGAGIALCGNGLVEVGEACDDGNVAAGDCCAGDCSTSAGDGTACSDETGCTASDACVAGRCVGVPAPASGCRASLQPERNELKITDGDPDERDQLQWQWRKGPSVTLAELGSPIAGDNYELCLFDTTGGVVAFARAPGGGVCNGRACWRAVGSSGFAYVDRERTPNGVRKLLARSGDSGRPQVMLKGSGRELGLPRLPLSLPVTVQLRIEGASCFEATYDASGVIRNDTQQFQGHGAH